MNKCNHKWVVMEDGTNDKFCVRCRKFVMQAVATFNDHLNMGVDFGSPLSDRTVFTVVNINQPSNIKNIARELSEHIARSKRTKGVFKC